MILVDSSVLIDWLRGRRTQETELLRTEREQERIAVADLCLFEVLQGLRDPIAFSEAHSLLTQYPITLVDVGGESVAVAAAQNAIMLRSKGIQPTAIDCLLATFCIMRGAEFLTADKDFNAFEQHLGLKLVR